MPFSDRSIFQNKHTYSRPSWLKYYNISHSHWSIVFQIIHHNNIHITLHNLGQCSDWFLLRTTYTVWHTSPYPCIEWIEWSRNVKENNTHFSLRVQYAIACGCCCCWCWCVHFFFIWVPIRVNCIVHIDPVYRIDNLMHCFMPQQKKICTMH